MFTKFWSKREGNIDRRCLFNEAVINYVS